MLLLIETSNYTVKRTLMQLYRPFYIINNCCNLTRIESDAFNRRIAKNELGDYYNNTNSEKREKHTNL